MTIFPASPELLEQRTQSVVEESAVNWHNLDEEDVLRRLAASLAGLTTEEVQVRQERFGRNILPVHPPPTLLQIILHQFKSPLDLCVARSSCRCDSHQ